MMGRTHARTIAMTAMAILVTVGLGALGFGRAGWLARLTVGTHRPARDRYNEGVAALAKRDYEAAEKALLDARSGAGVDPELRFRAAYDLGVALSAHADQVRTAKDADLARALELAQQGASWLGDAQRLRPDDADTRTNLGIVRARVQAISDELRKGEGKLEVRLDRLIGEQRGVLDEARAAWAAIKEAGGADPLAQQGTLTHLADTERGVVAEAGVIGDLAADEIDAIGKKPEDKRGEDEKVRMIQLKNLDLYLLEGRTRITEARRKLQELAAEDGVARSEAALVALKRAREQLLDPITVMRLVAQDELAVLADTARGDTRALALGDAKAPATPPSETADTLPGWLQPPAIAERQRGIRDRLEEVRARLTAALAPAPAPAHPPASGSAAPPASTSLHPPAGGSAAPPAPPAPVPPDASGGSPGPEDAKRAKLIERVEAALPAVAEASAAMERARQALGDQQIKRALEDEQAALEALGRAIEQFSELKQLVELAWAEHQELLALLAPDAAKQLDAAARARRTHELLSHDLGRMPRIQELIADEVAQIDEQGKQLAGKADEPAKDPKQVEAQKQALEQARQQLDQARQQMTHAQELRGQAAAALAALDKALAGNKDPMPPAKEADAKLTELRKIFFSVIEHLQELIREQGETRDQTSAASGEDDFTRAPKLPGLIGRQDGHAQMAKAITDALAQQADAAGKQPAQGPQQGPSAKSLAAAADEVRQSQGDMADARATLVKARDAKATTESLDPAARSQGKALEHLENALKLLQPPPQKNENDKDQQQPEPQKKEQQPQKQQDQQPQQGGAGQRARDEDARRQRERRDRDAQNDPVEKDW